MNTDRDTDFFRELVKLIGEEKADSVLHLIEECCSVCGSLMAGNTICHCWDDD